MEEAQTGMRWGSGRREKEEERAARHSSVGLGWHKSLPVVATVIDGGSVAYA